MSIAINTWFLELMRKHELQNKVIICNHVVINKTHSLLFMHLLCFPYCIQYLDLCYILSNLSKKS